jgi:hypothetical protein
MSSRIDVPKLLAFVAAGFLVTACAGAKSARGSDSVCAVHEGAPVTQIDIFDGDPADLASLAPDDDQTAPNTYSVKNVYAQGRQVTVRCHYGKTSEDVVLKTPVSHCQYSGGDAHPALACQ